MSSLRLCLFALLAFSLVSLAPRASAQDAAAETPAAEEHPTPTAPPYAQAVRHSIEKLVARDFDGAEVDAREALRLEPGRPEAHYYLAVALRAKGSGEEALAEYQATAQMGSAVSEPIWQVRGMQGAAEVLENLPGRLGDAREAWSQLLAFAQGNAGAIATELPRARITAIDRASEQERVYIEVRQRIAAREQELAQQAAEAARPQRRRRGRGRR
ncbi:MAG: hypothetical protein GXP55_20835 [Deltaproteobacteria bacterium]|nr:hypothetical protein [Deltaproteobacteria bacterium]